MGGVQLPFNQVSPTFISFVLITLLTGGESATDGVDYTGLVPQEVVFEDRDSATKTFPITVIEDVEPELAEQFTVVLSNPPGGSALIDPDSVSN